MEEIERHPSRGFTLFELLVVLTVLCVLIGLLLPSMCSARDRARYIKWAGYRHNLRIDPDLLVYLTFDNQEAAPQIHNKAVGDTFTDVVDAQPQPVSFPQREHQHPRWTWLDGRWKGKGGLHFHLNSTSQADAPALSESGAYLQFDDPLASRREKWTAFTFFTWIKQRTTHNGCILSRGDPEGDGLELFVANNNIHCRAHGRTISGNIDLGIDTPHLVAITISEKRKLSLWLDGVEQESIRLNRPVFEGDSPFFFGRQAHIKAGFLNAIVDEIGLMKRDLSHDRILELYKVGWPRPKNHPVDWMQIIFVVMTTIDGTLISVHFVFKPMGRMMGKKNDPFECFVIPERVDDYWVLA